MIVVAFDGLGKKKIEKHSILLKKMKEFGSIDESEWNSLATPELFASFLAGRKVDFGGKVSKGVPDGTRIEKVFRPFRHLPILWMVHRKITGKRPFDFRDWDSEDSLLKDLGKENCDIRIFPGYTYYTMDIFDPGVQPRELVERQLKKTLMYRKHLLFNDMLGRGRKEFIFHHFHYTDWMQHYWLDKKDREIVRECDSIAARVLEKAKEGELVLFLSDHGVEDGDHVKDAFYASNKELGLSNPKLEDFRAILNRETI